ncbi:MULTISPECIES: hypothetical protein [Streptomyces]|uniref:hypothetical protein n=1 Tax=Streptomyces TaxID=1883 RepID=UPI0021A3F622|nr:hypothetical protein [Streptomyces atratus]MCT2543352.1 hypothetical protein [Streptomyces atratus]
MKRILACAATVASLVAGLCAIAAPSASASASDIIFVNESGPGDAVVSQVKGSHHVTQSANDKSVTTGDISTWVKGLLQNSPLAFEVEGAEQDQGEKS